MGIGCTSVFGFPWADPLGGLAVSLLLLRTSISNAYNPLLTLLDHTPPPSTRLNNKLQRLIEQIVQEDDLQRKLQTEKTGIVIKHGHTQLQASIAYPASTTLIQLAADKIDLNARFAEFLVDEDDKGVELVIEPVMEKA